MSTLFGFTRTEPNGKVRQFHDDAVDSIRRNLLPGLLFQGRCIDTFGKHFRCLHKQRQSGFYGYLLSAKREAADGGKALYNDVSSYWRSFRLQDSSMKLRTFHA